MVFELPPLPYAYDALEPYVDALTMTTHHSKHHQAYVNNLNAFIASEKGANLRGKTLVEVIQNAYEIPVRNHGGGTYNHSLFWNCMCKPGTSKAEPTGELKTKIEATWGSLDAMKEKFNAAAATQFGSGWAWLGVKKDGSLAITNSSNQDNPMMPNFAEPMIPILALDVWEHAYYLKYQNRRPEYIGAFWSVVNWDQVTEYYNNFASKGQAVPL